MLANLPDPRRLPALVETLAGLLPRAFAMLDEAEKVLGRVDALLERIESTRQNADEVVERTDRVVSDANALIVRSAGTVASAEPVLERTQGLIDTLGPTLDDLGPVASRLLPTLERLAETTEPDEVEAFVNMVNQLPTLGATLQSDVMPLVRNLDSVGPDIHALLDTVSDLAAMLEKVPGINRDRSTHRG